MNQRIIRIATRKSPLALWQAEHVLKQLQQLMPNQHFELLPRVTSGDRFLKDKLQALGGKGLFVKELEEALLSGEADLAVHSSKDMPAHLPDGLELSAICKRDNPFDALVSLHFASINELPKGAVVGTASLRRQSQLLAYRPDLRVKPLRGNVNTRLSKLQSGEYQAILLAAAGLERMGLNQWIKELIPDDIMLPACGQGALCIESRKGDARTRNLVAQLNHPLSATCVRTERRVNEQLGGNCHVPLAVFCTSSGADELLLRAKIIVLDGSRSISCALRGTFDKAQELASQCTENLLAQGASELLGGIS
jgi:hydroxymethylbilane synthase